MAVLSARRRKKMRKSQFGAPKGSGPNRKKNQYPMPDRAHAANAKARATQMYKKGKLSKSKRDRIHAKANRILKRKKKGRR
jgi:hypothetical protein